MPTDQYWTRTVDGVELLERSTFSREDELQELINRHPELLARSIDDDPNARWLAIERELRITFADDEDVSHWRLDNLFIDGRGIPTLVEVKRSSDPRVRREVIAQLLDYAASFHADWSHGKLREMWRERAADGSTTSAITFDDFLASSAFDTEAEFWESVDTNVSAGKLRLLIVCDRLGGRLVRIIRFLNEQMEQVEVLGVAVQPRGAQSGQQTLSVEIEGAPDVPKAGAPAHRRDEAEFWSALRARPSVSEVAAVEALIAEMLQLSDSYPSMGSNQSDPCLFINYRVDGVGADVWPLRFSAKHGRVYLQMRTLKNRPGFEPEHARHEWRERMRRATGHPLDVGSLGGQPYFTTNVLADEDRRLAVLGEVRWVLDRMAEAAR